MRLAPDPDCALRSGLPAAARVGGDQLDRFRFFQPGEEEVDGVVRECWRPLRRRIAHVEIGVMDLDLAPPGGEQMGEYAVAEQDGQLPVIVAS